MISNYQRARVTITELWPGSAIARKPWQELYESGLTHHAAALSSSAGGGLKDAFGLCRVIRRALAPS